MKTQLLLTVVLLAFFGIGFTTQATAQSKHTENTLRLDENSKSAPAKLGDVRWLSGHWRGTGLGGQAHETWSIPASGSMVGTFRLIQDKKLTFSEFFVLMEQDDSLVLRLKHFDPLLNGWEEKDKYVEFKLVRVEGKTAYFDGLTYRLDDKGNLHAFVAMKQKDGTFKEGKFVYRAVSPQSKKKRDGDQTAIKEFPPIELPMDPDTVVLEYDNVGGFRIRPPLNFKPTPRLRVFADGKVIAGRNDPNLAEVNYQLNDRELMRLLRFIVDQKQIYEITTEGLTQQIKDTNRPVLIADAPSTQFKLELVRGKHEVSCYALMFVVNQYFEIEELRRLEDIRLRCEALRSRACLGDKAQAQRFIREINREFRGKHPGVGMFNLKDLVNAEQYADGKIVASFQRDFVNREGKTQKKFMAGVTKKGDNYRVDFREVPLQTDAQ